MARGVNGRTLTEDVYAAVRATILLGELAPGTRLALNDIARERGVSLGVVREAVTRLSSEGLVQATPQHGFCVRDISVPDLLDLTWMRIQLETMAIRRSIELGTLSWEAELVAAHHVLAATPPATELGTLNPAWAAAHGAFHEALVAACGSPTLLGIRRQLYDASELYRAWSVRTPGARDLAGEHSAILEAALARDVDLAVELLSEHLTATTRRLVEAQTDEDGAATQLLS